MNQKKEKEEEKKRVMEEMQKMKEPIIREAQERERKFQEEQRKIDEDAKNRNIEIERLDGKISDNLSTAGNMAKYGAVTTASSLLSGFFLITVADISTTTGLGAVVGNAIAYGLIGGAGVFALASLPLIGAGFYGLKRLAA